MSTNIHVAKFGQKAQIWEPFGLWMVPLEPVISQHRKNKNQNFRRRAYSAPEEDIDTDFLFSANLDENSENKGQNLQETAKAEDVKANNVNRRSSAMNLLSVGKKKM